MADNYLERQYAAYEARKAGRVLKPADRRRFYTRPVPTATHEEQQRRISEALAEARRAGEEGAN